MDKPIAHYTGPVQEHWSGGVMLTPVDHPGEGVPNGELCTTTRVLTRDAESGRIETLNTIYIPQ